MKNIPKAFWHFIKAHKIWSTIIPLVILVMVWNMISGGEEKVSKSFTLVEIGTIREEVSVTGNVKPLADVDLAFERGGRVATLNVSVGSKVYAGQILASVSNADLAANLDQAKANLKKVQAGLGDSADQTALELAQAKSNLVNAIKDSYTKTDDALRNKIYSLFDNPDSYNASLLFFTDSSSNENIEEGKNNADDALQAWNRVLTKTDISLDLQGNYDLANKNLIIIKNLLDKSALAVNGLSGDESNSQTQIEIWKSNISSARSSINLAIDSLNTYFNRFNTANLATQISGNNTLAEEASIEAAQAAVASAQAELAKSIITSPISGVVTDVPIKLGEIVPANQKALSVISIGDYQVESFVPEADISKINIGNKAPTTLDAYGDNVNFETKVIKIDPAATVIDDVPTYKVTLEFVNQDERVRSGMTANLDILTAEKEGVLVVPARAVYTLDGVKYVKLINLDNSETEVKVEVGLRGFDGKVEVISGLKVGDKVSTAL